MKTRMIVLSMTFLMSASAMAMGGGTVGSDTLQSSGGFSGVAGDPKVLSKFVPGANVLTRDGKLHVLDSVNGQEGTAVYSEGSYFQQTVKISDIAVPISQNDIGFANAIVFAKGLFGKSQVWVLGIFADDEILTETVKLRWDKTTYTRPVCYLEGSLKYSVVSRDHLEGGRDSIDDKCSPGYF